jgi:hypothetical protein
MTTQAITSEYLLLIRGMDWDRDLSPEEIQKIMVRWNTWYDGFFRQGKIVGGQPLWREAKTVSGKKGRTVADGPFAEAKELIAGYIMCRVSNVDEAVKIAQGCPSLDYGITIEVRPIAERCPVWERNDQQIAAISASVQ